jgi:hypothetical protein
MDDFSTGYSTSDQDALNGKAKLQKALKPKKTGLIIGLLFAVLTAAMAIAYFIVGNSQEPDPVFYDPCSGSTDYAYIDVQILTDYFAYYEENDVITEKYYFVLDANSDPFIVRLSDDQFRSLKEIYDFSYSDSTDAPDPVRITGVPKTIDSELRKMAISSFNEIWDDEYVTNDNFDSWLGVTYLDAMESPTAVSQNMILTFGIFFLVMTVVILIIAGSAYSHQNKRLKSIPSDAGIQEVFSQIAKPSCVSYPEVPLYLTDDYVVGFTNSIQVVPLADIRWVYTTQIQSGNARQSAVIVVTDRNFCVASLPASRKHKQKIEQMASAIYAKVPTALFGYTFENRKAMSEQQP